MRWWGTARTDNTDDEPSTTRWTRILNVKQNTNNNNDDEERPDYRVARIQPQQSDQNAIFNLVTFNIRIEVTEQLPSALNTFSMCTKSRMPTIICNVSCYILSSLFASYIYLRLFISGAVCVFFFVLSFSLSLFFRSSQFPMQWCTFINQSSSIEFFTCNFVFFACCGDWNVITIFLFVSIFFFFLVVWPSGGPSPANGSYAGFWGN